MVKKFPFARFEQAQKIYSFVVHLAQQMRAKDECEMVALLIHANYSFSRAEASWT